MRGPKMIYLWSLRVRYIVSLEEGVAGAGLPLRDFRNTEGRRALTANSWLPWTCGTCQRSYAQGSIPQPSLYSERKFT